MGSNINNIYIHFSDLECIIDTINNHHKLRTLSFIPNANNNHKLELILNINKYNNELKINASIIHLNVYYDLSLNDNLCLLHNIKKPFNLDLSNLSNFGYINSQNIKHLFEKNMPIIEFNLSNNHFINNLIDDYVLFKNINSLVNLNISDNQLCNIITLCNIIKHNPKLNVLNISYNKYDSQTDLWQLFNLLKENITISKLIIYGRSKPDTSNMLYLLISILQLQNSHIKVIY